MAEFSSGANARAPLYEFVESLTIVTIVSLVALEFRCGTNLVGNGSIR